MAVAFSLVLLVSFSAIFGFLAPPCVAKIILYSGETLYPGRQLTYQSYSLAMQTDCNLVLYEGKDQLWESKTQDRGQSCISKLQYDGNLVLSTNCGEKSLWTTKTKVGQGNYVLILQKDRGVVLYGGALWATGTNLKGTAGVNITQNATVVAAAATASVVPTN